VSATYVSIVLPTRNGAATLPALLDAIARQRVDFPFEVIAVDSGSTDGTLDVLHTRVDQVITIAADAFDHGLTRNLAIEQARGELIVLMVQDALPASNGWLAALTTPLLADDRVAGAFARQRPRADASAITRHYLDRWMGSSDVPRTVCIDDRAEFEALEPMAQLERCTFDNVCSCIRRRVWIEHPFRPTAIGEDLAWAKEVLLAGYRLSYVPDAEVVHSHDRSARYELARTYTLHRELYHLFRLRTIPTLPLLMRAIMSSLAVHLRCEKNGRAIALAFAWPIGQYLGALAAVNGWKPFRSRMV
jgi:glycosyltransferase involved in cell wall biosynthesis